MKLTFVGYLYRTSSYFTFQLVQFCLCVEIFVIFRCLSQKYETHIHVFPMPFALFFQRFGSVDLFWIVVVVVGFCLEAEGKIIRNAKMRKDKYSWISNSSYNIMSTQTYTRIKAVKHKRKWTHHYRHHMNCTKNSSNIETDENSVWRECVIMLCVARSQRLNQITSRILNK